MQMKNNTSPQGNSISRGSRPRFNSASSSSHRRTSGSSVSSSIPEEDEANVDTGDDGPNIVKILSMNGYRDTRSWDSLTGKIKRRVIAPRRATGDTVPKYPSFEEDEEETATQEEVPEWHGRALTDDELLLRKFRAAVKLEAASKGHKAPTTLKDISTFDQPDIQSNFCFSCWMLVAAAPVGLSCQYCPVIAHRHCVDKIQVQAKKNIRAIRQKNAACRRQSSPGLRSMDNYDDDPSDFDESDSEISSPRDCAAAVHEMSTEELNLKWVCPFCIEILHDMNEHEKEKEATADLETASKKKLITVTATAKMFVARKKWITRVRNSIRIQRFMRARATMVSLRNELRATKSVVRVGLHEVELRLVVNAVEPNHEGHEIFKNIGQFGSVMLSQYVKAVPTTKPHLKPAIDIFKTCIGPGVHIRPAERAVSANSLVLTVTVHDMLDGDKQIYRLDSPLVESVRKRTARTQIKNPVATVKLTIPPDSNEAASLSSAMPHSTVIGEDSDNFSIKSTTSDSSSKTSTATLNKKSIYFRPQLRGVMVFPACHADIFIRFTVSEVSKWPNATAICRTELQVTDFILKRQATVFSQQLEHVHRGDKLIEMAPLTRLNVANARSSRTEPSRFQLGHGRLTWAFIPATGSSTMAGPLLLLPDVDAWGAKKRTWSVIIDKSLYVYGSTADLIPKEVFDLSNCKVFLHDNEVIEIEPLYGTRKSIFAFCTHPSQRSQWWGQISQCGQGKSTNPSISIPRGPSIDTIDSSIPPLISAGSASKQQQRHALVSAEVGSVGAVRDIRKNTEVGFAAGS